MFTNNRFDVFNEKPKYIVKKVNTYSEPVSVLEESELNENSLAAKLRSSLQKEEEMLVTRRYHSLSQQKEKKEDKIQIFSMSNYMKAKENTKKRIEKQKRQECMEYERNYKWQISKDFEEPKSSGDDILFENIIEEEESSAYEIR